MPRPQGFADSRQRRRRRRRRRRREQQRRTQPRRSRSRLLRAHRHSHPHRSRRCRPRCRRLQLRLPASRRLQGLRPEKMAIAMPPRIRPRTRRIVMPCRRVSNGRTPPAPAVVRAADWAECTPLLRRWVGPQRRRWSRRCRAQRSGQRGLSQTGGSSGESRQRPVPRPKPQQAAAVPARGAPR